MLRPIQACAAGLMLAAAPVLADGTGQTPAPSRGPDFYQSPTDEYVPPRARRRDSRLAPLFAPPGRYARSFAYSYGAPAAPLYFYAPATGYDRDRAPCPTLSR